MPASRRPTRLRQQVQLPRVPQGQGPAPDHRQRPGRRSRARDGHRRRGQRHYPLAIDDCDLYPIAKPEFDETDLVEAGKPYTFSFTVTVKPEIEISSYEPVEIELPAEGTTDAEIDEQIDALREHYYSFEDASAATKVKEDSYIDLAMKATDDKGEEIPSLTTENRPYGLGANLFPAEFDEQLVGLKKGQTATFTLDMPADPPIMLSALAGKTEKINFESRSRSSRRRSFPRSTTSGQGADGLRKRRGPACAHRRVRHQPEGRHDAAPEGETPACTRSPSAWRATAA